MANKSVLSLGSTIETFVSQIAVGGETPYSIAVEKGIRFFNGQSDNAGTLWYGQGELEVVIPSVTDIITDPVRLVGTINAQGAGAPETPKNGDLVFIAADCTFADQVCEAGDMAVYTTSDSSWHVISGENQVTIKNATPTSVAANKTEVSLNATPVTVLDVEGKELVLSIAADLVKSNLGVKKNGVDTTSVTLSSNAVADVDSKYITLGYTAAASDTTIGSNKTVAVATSLADGTVTLSGDTSLVKPGDIASAWTAGTDGAHESAAVEFAISGNVSLSVDANGNDFVTGWTSSTSDFVQTALKSASLKVVAAADKAQDETIAINPFLTSNPTFTNDSTEFATAIVTAASGADFIVPGAVSVSAETAKAATNGVLVDVVLPTLGDDSSFTDVNYASADASTGVIATIADPTVTINGGSVIASVSVSDNVLIITPGTVTASASQGAVTYKKAQYKKTVVSNTPSVSYGSIQTADGQGYKLSKQAVNASLTPGAISYIGVQTAEVSASDKASAYIGLTASKASYTGALAAGASGSIAAGNVITSVTDAVVPVLAAVSATGSMTAALSSTALTTSNVTVGEFAEGGTSINIGTWALGESPTEVSGGIEVAAPGTAAVSGTIVVASNTFITDVYADPDLDGAPEIASTDRVSVLVPTA